MSANSETFAPGWPGIPARWTSSAKTGLGTSISRNSRVWFTLSHGILNEIYYPRVDQACTRDFGFIVTDGRAYFSEEKHDARSDTSQVTPGVLAYRMRNTAIDGRYRIELLASSRSMGSCRFCRLRGGMTGQNHPLTLVLAGRVTRHPRTPNQEMHMSDEIHDEGPHRRPHSQAMAGPFLELDLTREMAQFHGEPEWKNGHNARTLVKYDDLRIVLIGLKAGARMPEHKAGGRVSIHTISGRVRVRAQGRTFDLPAGRVLVLDHGLPHDVDALEESALLLTLAWPGRTPMPAPPESR